MVWGRGALDMKSEVAANAVAMASLAREGFKPSGDLIFAATADEEAGDGFGLEWLCEAHPDAVRCDFAINEGGGDRIELEDGRPLYLPTVAEKMTAPFRLTVQGPLRPRVDAGHRRQRARQVDRADRADRRVSAGAADSGRRSSACCRRCSGEVPPASEAVRRMAGSHRLPPSCSTRSSGRPSRRRSSPPRRSGTSSPRCARSRSTAGFCPASIRSTSSR